MNYLLILLIFTLTHQAHGFMPANNTFDKNHGASFEDGLRIVKERRLQARRQAERDQQEAERRRLEREQRDRAEENDRKRQEQQRREQAARKKRSTETTRSQEKFDIFADDNSRATPTTRPPKKTRTTYGGKVKSTAIKRCKLIRTGEYKGRFKGHGNIDYFGCDSPYLTANLIGRYKYADKFPVTTEFKTFLTNNMKSCAAQGLRAQGIRSSVGAIHISAYGTYRLSTAVKSKNDEPRFSFHSTGRAIDIGAIRVFTSDGKKRDFKMTYGERKRPFYEAFNECFRAANKRRCGTYKGGVLDWRHNHGGSNDHHSHIHLAMPYCKKGRHPKGVNRS